MNSEELKNIIRKDKFMKNIFMGIYACDEIHNLHKTERPTLFIANTDPSSMTGQHWVAFYTNGKTVEYFCSYGIQPFVLEFKDFLTHFKNIKINTVRLQSSHSKVCGLYCIYYMYHKSRGKTLEQILKTFEPKKYCLNDKNVCRFIHRVFGIHTKVCCNNTQKCKSLTETKGL